MPARELRDQQETPSALVTPGLNLQRTAVEIVLADFEAAKTARTQIKYGRTAKGQELTFDTWLQELKDLYFGQRLPKVTPWKFCSNRSLMIAMAILEVLHSRIFPAIYNEELTRWRPTNVEDVERAERVEKFMFWWVRVHAKLREFFDRWTRMVIGFGSVCTVTRWDVQLLDKGETQPTEPMVGPDGMPTEAPPQKVMERLESSRSDIIAPDDLFLQPGASDIQRDTVIIRRKYLFRDLEDMERDGKVVNITMPTVEGEMPLRERLVVPSAAGEGVTPEQQQELESIRKRNVPVECLEWYGGIDLDGDGFPEQMRLLINAQYRLFLGGVALSTLSKRGMRHLDMTQFLPRLDEPQGLRGIGVLEQVKELALEIDAIFNQLTDANSMAVMRPGFYDPFGDLDAAALNLAPNKMTPMSRPQENIFFPQVDVPTERLMLAVRLVLEFIEKLTSASSYLFGNVGASENVGGSGTATRTQALVGASGQRISIPAQRLREGTARIMTQHLDLVQVNLPPGMERRVMGERGEPLFEGNELVNEALAGEYDAYLLPDESLGSKESERQLAAVLYQLLTTNLIVATDPTKLYKVTADLLKAYGKDPEQYLGIAPDVKQTDRPEDENTLILQGSFASVKASVLDNPIEHVLAHQQITNSPVFLSLPPEMQQQILAFTQAHIQEHLQLMQLMAQLSTQVKPGKGGGNAAQSNGAPRGGARPAAPVGPEPWVGAVSNPSDQARAAQRVGESQAPT